MVGEVGVPSRLIDLLRSASHVAILTGSGVSAESGVPTFREAQTGLWSRYDPKELATAKAFKRNPRLVWEWYQWRRQLISEAQPNDAHKALAVLEERLPKLTLVTQNVDGLHQQAGSQNVIELHGNISRTRCSEEGAIVSSWNVSSALPPRCPQCGGPLRPDVVWFGESLPVQALADAISGARSCELFFSIGTSAIVQPAASLAFEARSSGAEVVEINLETTPLTPFAAHILVGQAGRVLPAILEAAFP